jgi:hypothetical protein
LIRRVFLTAAAIAALGAAAAVAVVAAAFALYAVLQPGLSPAGSAAVVAAIAALAALVGGLVLTRKSHPPQKEDTSPTGRLLDIARERPVLAAAAAVAAGVVALRNPKIMAAVVSAFVAGRTAKH